MNANELAAVTEAVREAAEAGEGWWSEPSCAARRATAALGMTWDFISWPHALRCLESAEAGERVFGVLVEG